jgi:uncharacterized protein YbjT (DUF2867 family)
MKRILVTGATGNIGREVVTQLRARGCPIRALSRSPQSATLPPDVEVVRGDLAAPVTLEASLDGVDAVFLVWVAPVAAARQAVERIAAHAERIVLLSSPHRTPHPFFQQPNALRLVHETIDRLVETSSLPWTILRPHAFALNCLNWWGPQLRNGDVVRWFHATAATAPIDERDLAAVAVRALCDEGHGGMEYVLTGPASLTQREQVEIIGDAIGRPLRFEELSPEIAGQELLRTWPAPAVDMLLNAYGAAVGRLAFVTSTVADVTGVRARSFHDWAVHHASDFLRNA